MTAHRQARLAEVPVRRLIAAALVVVLAAGGCSASADGAAEASSGPDETTSSSTTTAPRDLEPPNPAYDLLFVARSHAGTLDTAEDGTVTLTLEDTDTITWFSDRPDHDAGVSSARDALESFGWTEDGDDLGEPPNSALIAAELGDDTPIVELLDASLADGNITFEILFVGDAPAVTGRLTHVDLFIDSVAPRLTGTVMSGANSGGYLPPKYVRTPKGDIYNLKSYQPPQTAVNPGTRVTFEVQPAWIWDNAINVALA